MRLLLVEDNPGDARLLRELLRDADVADLAIVEATRLDSAEAILAEGRFDIVLLDLSLPDSSGLETVQRAQGFRFTSIHQKTSASGR
jgi:DNA-binding response OmpR family regulator